MIRLLILFPFLLLSLSTVSAQKFHFGVNAAVVASQVDGDELSGFNKWGYRGGLLGGYSFNETHWLVLELQYADYGSRKRNEELDMNMEVDMGSLNVLVAYSVRFGDSWDGFKKFRVLAGPQFNRVLSASGPNIREDNIRQSFFSAHVAVSYVLTESVLIDLSYTHAVANILEEPLMLTDTLVPYYLSLGVNYYIFK